MALNFLTGRGTTTDEAATPTDDSESNDETSSTASRRRPTRRGSRGGRSASARTADADARDEAEPAPERAPRRRRTAADDDAKPAPARASSRRRASDDEEPAPTRARGRRRAAADDEPAPARASTRRRAPADDDEPAPPRRRRTAAAKADDDDAEPAKRPATRRRSRAATAEPDDGNAALLAALQEQNEKLSRLIELQERSGTRGPGDGAGAALTAATLPRVGIFVDSANVELARDRSGRRIDWGVVLEHLTEDRRLVRAIAYSPVHDDPGVSRETQRFVEPFLRKGYKIVTKPLKRFADGTIKANVDIELALDLLTMSDRLDIAVLISGDGDFTHLVEVVQGRGVRVEVAGIGSSVAGGLRNAADRYIELDFALK